jgi:alpha-beta hydrolase superfamily lysophospholipase
MTLAPATGFFDASDGLKLFCDWYLPADAAATPRAVIVVAHGYGEHAGRYAQVARRLAAGGFAVMTFDTRGHGQAGGRRGHCDAFDEFLLDLDRACGQARAGVPDRPLAILGHSHGGLVTLRALAEPGRTPKGVAAAVLASPFLGLALKVPPVKAAVGRLASRLFPKLSLPNGIDPKTLSHDSRVAEAYMSDRFNHHVATARWFTEVTAAQAYVAANASHITLPTLWLVAGGDLVADSAAARRVYEAAGGDKTLRVYDGLYHELLNETDADRERVLGDLEAWLSARFPAP